MWNSNASFSWKILPRKVNKDYRTNITPGLNVSRKFSIVLSPLRANQVNTIRQPIVKMKKIHIPWINLKTPENKRKRMRNPKYFNEQFVNH